MKVRWEDLAARARGLATHLLTQGQLDALARSPDLDALRDGLRGHGFLLPDAGPMTPDLLELAVRRTAAGRLQTLARWARARNVALAIVFEDEDRRSLRALLRGAVQGAAPEERLAGLIPTPALPERALGELAAQPSPATIATLLTVWGSPYGPALLPQAAATHPDLLTLEYSLNRVFATRALRGARVARSRGLLAFVRETIDVENACTAIVLAGTEKEVPATEAFLLGGRRLVLPEFLDAIAARAPAEAGRRLAAAFRPASVYLAVALDRAAGNPPRLEEALLRARITALQAAARIEPSGPATLLAFILSLRAEVLGLRRVIWSVALGVPSPQLASSVSS